MSSLTNLKFSQKSLALYQKRSLSHPVARDLLARKLLFCFRSLLLPSLVVSLLVVLCLARFFSALRPSLVNYDEAAKFGTASKHVKQLVDLVSGHFNAHQSFPLPVGHGPQMLETYILNASVKRTNGAAHVTSPEFGCIYSQISTVVIVGRSGHVLSLRRYRY